MKNKKTLEQKYYDLDREFDKKKYEMEKRVDIKREKKHKKDQDRISTEKKNKNKQLEKKKHLKKMNIKHAHNNRPDKIKKTPASRKNAKNQAKKRHNRNEKLKFAFQEGNTFYGICYTHVGSHGDTKMLRIVKYENGEFIWNNDAQAGHMIKKGSGDSLLFYSPVFRLQCRECNCYTAEDQHMRKMQRKEEVGEEVYDKAVEVKNQPFDMTTADIVSYWKEMQKKVMGILENLK